MIILCLIVLFYFILFKDYLKDNGKDNFNTGK